MAPPSWDRSLWRLAGRIAVRLVSLAPPLSVQLDFWRLTAAQKLSQRMDDLVRRGWSVSVAQLREELKNRLTGHRIYLDEILASLDSEPHQRQLPRQRLVYEELCAARDEFDDFSFDLRNETVTIVSEEITLDDLELGRFRIVLNALKLPGNPLGVIAETPNTPVSRSDVTHPHVMDHQLCLGDAKAPLALALRTGRLYDYFQIVQQTLHT